MQGGGIFNIRLTTNLLRNLPVKKMFKLAKIWQNYGHEFVAYFFGPRSYLFITYLFYHTLYQFTGLLYGSLHIVTVLSIRITLMYGKLQHAKTTYMPVPEVPVRNI